MAFGNAPVAEGTGGTTHQVAVDSVAGSLFGRMKKANPNADQTGAYGTDADPERVRPRRRGTADYDSGRVAVGDTLGVVTGATIYPESLLVTNLTAVERWLTVTDTAGAEWISQLPLAPRETRVILFPPTSMVGVKMQASAAASVVAVMAGAQ